MAFTKHDLEAIKSKIQLSTEIEKKTKIIKKGKDFWCCCLFHKEKTASCKINNDIGSYYCFGCGAKGDIFSLYTDLFNYTFLDAVKELAQKAGIQINFENKEYSPQQDNVYKILELSTQWFQENLKVEGNDCKKYLIKRSLSEDTINTFRLGYSYNAKTSLYDYLKSNSLQDDEIIKSNVVKIDKNKKIKDFFYKRLIFPITNLQDRVVGFGARALDNSKPKYINSPESNFFRKRNLLYNLQEAKKIARQKKNLLVCEGYMDVISLYQKGIKSVVAPLGTSFTEDQLLLSWRYVDKPTIMFDGDNAGIKASYKAAIMSLPYLIPDKFLQFIKLPMNLDPDSYLNLHGSKSMINLLRNPITLVNFIFNESSKAIQLNNAEQKISYDKYLDDLIGTVKNKKIQYFFKSEFKTLFFKKLKQKNNKSIGLNLATDLNVLKQKQIFSFLATLINHIEIRTELLASLENSFFLSEDHNRIIKLLKNPEYIEKKSDDLLEIFSHSQYSAIIESIIDKGIYQLFPYSSPKFDPQNALVEAKESIKNLNTRLSNLKKINKSLNNFESEISSLNWEELQRIGMEIQNNKSDI